MAIDHRDEMAAESRSLAQDRVPWSTGIYSEKPDSGPSGDLTCAGKALILRDIRVQIPYAAEHGNKSDEQGDKIADQGIKSAEHGTARQTRSGRLRWSARVRSAAVGASLRPQSSPRDSGIRLDKIRPLRSAATREAEHGSGFFATTPFQTIRANFPREDNIFAPRPTEIHLTDIELGALKEALDMNRWMSGGTTNPPIYAKL
jgi:hypothetical protein